MPGLEAGPPPHVELGLGGVPPYLGPGLEAGPPPHVELGSGGIPPPHGVGIDCVPLPPLVQLFFFFLNFFFFFQLFLAVSFTARAVAGKPEVINSIPVSRVQRHCLKNPFRIAKGVPHTCGAKYQ